MSYSENDWQESKVFVGPYESDKILVYIYKHRQNSARDVKHYDCIYGWKCLVTRPGARTFRKETFEGRLFNAVTEAHRVLKDHTNDTEGEPVDTERDRLIQMAESGNLELLKLLGKKKEKAKV
jgi:hypothetical protein